MKIKHTFNWSFIDSACPPPYPPELPEPIGSDWPECEEFYNLMQAYRHAPMENQKEVVNAYEAVKSWLLKNHSI